ncbi:MAG: AMP-binding protein [Novosphingobium sp.]|nr:AMP-binding protein [Novosphingobium sp.]
MAEAKRPGLTTLNEQFMAALEAVPDRTFMDFEGDQYSYDAMEDQIARVARGLESLGIQHGDRVVTLLETGPDGVICWFAINRLGAINVPINTAYMGDFLRHQVNESGARIAICENEFIARFTDMAGEMPAVEHLLYRGNNGDRGSWHAGFAALDEYRLDQGETPLVKVDPADLAAIIYTSGTTGMSKGCMASHNYFCDLPWRNAAAIGRTGDDIYWSPLPLFHIAGICVVVSSMMLQGTGSLARKFSVSGFWPEIKRSGANVAMLLGSMAKMIADEPDTDVSKRCHGQIRTLVAAPLPAELPAIWKERFGLEWVTGRTYGSTECGQALEARFDSTDAPPSSCGRANDAFDVRVFDENDEDVGPDVEGEIVVRPRRPLVMYSGYWNNPQATIAASHNLWHHMGDRARVDEAGNFFFVDRSKDVIRRRGENISSYEMELTFSTHPEVSEVAIHAVASDVTEDDVKATVVLRQGASTSETDIREWAKTRIPKFALPRYIEFRSELPKNPIGRIRKFELRAEGVTSATWDSQSQS